MVRRPRRGLYQPRKSGASPFQQNKKPQRQVSQSDHGEKGNGTRISGSEVELVTFYVVLGGS